MQHILMIIAIQLVINTVLHCA